MHQKCAERLDDGPWIVGIGTTPSTVSALESCLLDEAGRGPVIGPMVYAAAYCPLHFENSLRDMKLDDSKVLSRKVREARFQEMQETAEIGFIVDSIPAQEISSKMLEESPISLNLVALESTFKILKAISTLGMQIEQVYVDTLGKASAHEKRLKDAFPEMEFTVRPKADALYPIVSAASIIAKVLRDNAIAELEKSVDGNFGSGYPSDPTTAAWLRENVDPVFGFPSVVRFSWSTCTKVLDNSSVKVIWKERKEKKARQRNLLQYRSMKETSEAGIERSTFFKNRGLQRSVPNIYEVIQKQKT